MDNIEGFPRFSIFFLNKKTKFKFTTNQYEQKTTKKTKSKTKTQICYLFCKNFYRRCS